MIFGNKIISNAYNNSILSKTFALIYGRIKNNKIKLELKKKEWTKI